MVLYLAFFNTDCCNQARRLQKSHCGEATVFGEARVYVRNTIQYFIVDNGRGLIGSDQRMTVVFKNMGRRLFHVVPKKWRGTGHRRPEWREYSGYVREGMSVTLTSACDSLQYHISSALES